MVLGRPTAVDSRVHARKTLVADGEAANKNLIIFDGRDQCSMVLVLAAA